MKKSFKKILALALSVMLVFSLVACNGGTESGNEPATEKDPGKTLKIGVIQYVSHPSLDNCYEGIESAFKASGLKYELDRQVGSDATSEADCATYAQNMVAQKYDIIFAIATPAAASAFAATEGTDIPLIFCAVNDPVGAKLVKSLEEPGDLCTGTSDALDHEGQIALIKAFQPDVKKVGIIYTTSEANSISNLAVFKKLAEKNGLEVEAVGIQNDADIPAAAKALAGKVDCINNFTDNKVVNNLQIVLDAAKEANIPVYGSEIEQVKNGCLASASLDYVALGETTGKMGIKVLGGEDITKMAVEVVTDSFKVANEEMLDAFSFSRDAVKGISVV